ncbi:MAG: type II toxin-antitoxin system prevent-host-death family antitoxin [Deltaproteobacteria bacterium]|nr:type II toxin-antitoxin system prevent-host-death family antitoxin [Deltaproteobacteria bacterium]
MSKSVGSYEAKTHLPKLLELVEHGGRVTITKHGRPVAMLVPAGPAPKHSVKEVIAALREFRRGHTLGKAALGDFIREGRR